MSSSSGSYHITVLLDKMCCRDKDFRFMATNDLMSELQRDSLKMDDECEKKVVRIILKLLEDKNGEVQNLAVRCLGPLVLKIKEAQVDYLVENLCNSMVIPPSSDSSSEGIRGICGMGLKTVINEVPSNSTSLASLICKQVTNHLVQAVNTQEDVAIKLECLELLTDLLHRFGPLMTVYHDSILKLCVGQLQSPRFAVRKRAINTLSQLVTCCSAQQYEMLIGHLISQLNVAVSNSQMKLEDIKTIIQCTAAITRQSNRAGDYSVRIVDPLAQCLQKYKDDEVQEYVLQALEIMFRKCPKQMNLHLNDLLPLCYVCLQYDPNYAYDEPDDDDEHMTGDEDEEDLDEEDEDYSDDDDMSWKVRRAAAKCMEAIVATYPELLSDFYSSMAPLLVRRIIEREENVRCEVFVAIITLLKQTKAFSAMHKRQQLPPSDGALVIPVVETMDDDKDPLTQLHSLIPALVRALQRQVRSRSIRTRQGSFAILKEVTLTLPGCFSNHMGTLVPGLSYVMRDKASTHNLRVETLIFINSLLSTHQPSVFLPHVHTIIDIAVECAEDQFYRTSSEALGLIQLLTQVIRPNPAVSQEFDFRPAVKQLYHPAFKQLLAADRDLEIKEKAIISVAQLVYTMADVLESQLGDCLPVLVDRLRNEITRLQAVKALNLIARSPLNVDLRFILSGCVQSMSSFLRKNDRALRVASLSCLDLLWKRYGTYIDPGNLSNTMVELPALISDNDLYLTQLALQLLTTILRIHGEMVIHSIREQLLPHLIPLAFSPLLHGAALESILVFFSLAARVNTGEWNFQFLLTTLLAPLRSSSETPNRDAYPNLAKCMAEVLRPDPNDQAMYHEKSQLVDQMITDLRATETSNNFRYLYMLCLGEIGRTVDMSGKAELMRTIQEAFDSKAEEIKTGAAMTLGKIALGKLDRFIPFIISEIQNQPKQQYFLLHSLREIIGTVTQNTNMFHKLQPYMDSIWSLLLNHAACNEEGARNLVAECMGKLALMDPQTLLPRLRQQLIAAAGGDPDQARVRCTVVTAFKFTIINVPNPAVDQLLRESIKEVLQCIHDDDLNVRRAALVTFNTAAHNKPMLIRDLLSDMLPLLYRETLVRKELIREVEMGPFKHMEDDGLDLRKVAFECMYTLLDTCLDRIDIFEFLSHVEHGLKDHSDILMLTHLMLVRLCSLVPHAVYQRMEQLLAPLKMTLTGKMRADPVKQEVEKQSELKRAALRVVVALMKLPDADKHRQLNEFLKTTIQNSHELSAMFQSVEKDVHTRQE